MVCIYCSSSTVVKNSRLQHYNNHVWRRRSCVACGNIFTTIERPDLAGAFVVSNSGPSKHSLEPFSRDRLFLTIYTCCKHRPNAIDEAASLTQTIIKQLIAQKREGIIERSDIVAKAYEVLKRFDAAAATIFAAYHKDDMSATNTQTPTS